MGHLHEVLHLSGDEQRREYVNMSQVTTVNISEYCAVNNFVEFFALVAAYNENQTNTHKTIRVLS